MKANAVKLVINLWHDDCADDPTHYDGWKVYSFSTRHVNFRHPDTLDEDELGPKLKSGLAFWLSYFEHGNCAWSLSGEGPQCRWDSVQRAGILVWEDDEDNIGAKTYEEREEDARRVIARYTDWCNGSVYGYTVEAFRKCCECGFFRGASDVVDFDLPSVGGYYGDDVDGMVIDMKDNIGDDWSSYEVSFNDNMGGWLADEVKRHWRKVE